MSRFPHTHELIDKLVIQIEEFVEYAQKDNLIERGGRHTWNNLESHSLSSIKKFQSHYRNVARILVSLNLKFVKDTYSSHELNEFSRLYELLIKLESLIHSTSLSVDNFNELEDTLSSIERIAIQIEMKIKKLKSRNIYTDKYLSDQEYSFDKEQNAYLEKAIRRIIREIHPSPERIQQKQNEIDTLFKAAEEARQKISEIYESATEECKHISSLNKNITDTSLAKSFNEEKQRLVETQRRWLVGIATSVFTTMWLGYYLMPDVVVLSSTFSIIASAISRLFIIAPLVWVVFFCASHYGQARKAAEDYAFKTSMTVAFNGYFNYLADDKNAQALLNTKTLEAITNDPLRFYIKNHATISENAEYMEHANKILEIAKSIAETKK